MKFIENIYFDESQNKYIIDHSKGISTIDKENIKHIKYQYAYTNKYWFSFPLVILLIILNFSYRNFSYPNFFEHKLAYILLIIILLIGLILCVEFLRFFRSKFTIYHEKNETFYFNQDTASFNIYGAFESHEINCLRSKPNFDKQNLLLNSFFPIFCLIVPTFLFVGSVQSFSPKLNVLFISDFTFINSLWFTSIILVLIRYRDSALAFIYVPILLFIGFLNIWEKKYTEIVYHQIFTAFQKNGIDKFEKKSIIISSLFISNIFFLLNWLILEISSIPFIILIASLTLLYFHRIFYVNRIDFWEIEKISLFYLCDSEIANNLILTNNHLALATINPLYFEYYEHDLQILQGNHIHLYDKKVWINNRFYELSNESFNFFFPDFIKIYYYKESYLDYIMNSNSFIIIPHFVLDEEILNAILIRGYYNQIKHIVIRFFNQNNSNKRFDKLIKNTIKFDGKLLESASEELKNDKKTVMLAVRSYGCALNFASKELKKDRDIVIEAVKSDGNALLYVSEELKSDRNIVIEAVKSKGCALKYSLEEFRADKEIVLEAIKSDSLAINFASNKLKNDEEIIKNKFKNENYEESQIPFDISFSLFDNINPEGFLEKELFEFKDISKSSREVVLGIVKINGLALAFASEEFQNDKEIVYEAVKSDGRALEYASNKLKADKEIVLKAVNSYVGPPEFVSNKIDPEHLVLDKLYYGPLEFASIELQADKEVVMDAVISFGYSINFASKKLQSDFEIIEESVKSMIKYESPDFKKNIQTIINKMENKKIQDRNFINYILLKKLMSNRNKILKIYHNSTENTMKYIKNKMSTTIDKIVFKNNCYEIVKTQNLNLENKAKYYFILKELLNIESSSNK